MNMRMDPDCLALDPVELYKFNADLTSAQLNSSFGGTLQTWWQRVTAPRTAAQLQPIEPDLCLPFADTEATWCLR